MRESPSEERGEGERGGGRRRVWEEDGREEGEEKKEGMVEEGRDMCRRVLAEEYFWCFKHKKAYEREYGRGGSDRGIRARRYRRWRRRLAVPGPYANPRADAHSNPQDPCDIRYFSDRVALHG